MHHEETNEKLGSAQIYPNTPIPVNTKNTWEIIYTVGQIPLKPSGKLRITIPYGFPIPQDKAFFDRGFTTIESTAKGVEFSIEIVADVFCRLDRNSGHSGAWGRSIFIEIQKQPMYEGEQITIIYGNADYYHNESFSKAGAFSRELSGKAEFTIAVDPDGTRQAPYSGYWRILDQPTIEILPGPPTNYKCIIPTNLAENQIFSAKIIELDQYNNPVSIHTQNQTIDGSEEETKRIQVPYNNHGLNSNPARISEKIPNEKIYWGDIHGHTLHSDGLGTLEEYYEYAQNVACLDFSAITDHDDIGPGLSPEEFHQTKEITEKYYQPNEFVTFFGHEYRNGLCDMNFYYKNPNCVLLRGTNGNLNNAKIVSQKVRENEGMVIPHMHFGADWSGYKENTYRVMEIYSQHGSAEYPRCPREIPYLRKQVQKSSKSNENCYAHDALNLGFKLGFTAGSDTHSGRPGLSDWTRNCRTYLGGLTAVYAKEKTREAIWDAIYNRHCYATTGNRSVLTFDINNNPMGSEIIVSSEIPLKIQIQCIADGQFSQFRLYRSGKVWIEKEISGDRFDFHHIETPQDHQDWFYVRFILTDGEMIWSSPIWISHHS